VVTSFFQALTGEAVTGVTGDRVERNTALLQHNPTGYLPTNSPDVPAPSGPTAPTPAGSRCSPRPVRQLAIPTPPPVRSACIPTRGRFRHELSGMSGAVGWGQLLGQRRQGADEMREHLLWR